MATWWEELTHLKRPWCWERLRAGGEGDDRGWDGWTASPTQWTWVWVDSRSWWWTGRPGVLRFMGSQRVGHDWATELNWTEESVYLFNLYTNQIQICLQILVLSLATKKKLNIFSQTDFYRLYSQTIIKSDGKTKAVIQKNGMIPWKHFCFYQKMMNSHLNTLWIKA